MSNLDTSTPLSGSGCLSYIFFALASLWVIGATFFIHFVAWFVDQLLLAGGLPARPLPGWAWLPISWAHGLVLALLVVPLALFTRAPRFRSVYQTWALATAYVFLLGLSRIFPMTWAQPAALAQITLNLLAVIGLVIFAYGRGRRFGLRTGALWPALALAPIVALPSLLWGALGSPLDSLLNLLAALSFGLVVGVLLGAFLIQPLAERATGSAGEMAFSGFAAGVALLSLGAGFGFAGSQLLLMISLPPLGMAVMGVSRFAGTQTDRDRSWLPIAGFTGFVAAAPLMLVDPDELALVVGDLLPWAFRAAGVALLLAGLVGGVLWALRPRIQGPPNLAFSLGGLVLTWMAGLLLYLTAGQPGFYSEHLFVILKDQADVSSAASIEDRDERLSYVYTTLTQHADSTQADLREALDLIRAEYQPYYLVNALEVNGGPVLRAYLAAQPEVDRILDSPHLRPIPASGGIALGGEPAPTQPQWNLTSLGADRVWEELGVTGEGIVVGQSDSGVQGDHPALREGYRGRNGENDYNWLDLWNGTSAPTDTGIGHGTHTLGSVLGRGVGAGAPIGVAPGAEWFGCTNLARNLG
ncbi:MAG: S8 family serine peptidase, partial [Anaerolineales bacterium]